MTSQPQAKVTPATVQPKAKILVSDDDMNVRLLTRQCLEAEGMTVVEAADGQQALEAFLRERPTSLQVWQLGIRHLSELATRLGGHPALRAGYQPELRELLDTLRQARSQATPAELARLEREFRPLERDLEALLAD